MKKVLSAFLALVFTLSTIQCMSVLSFSVGNSNYKPKSISSMSQAVPIETDKTYTESLSNRNDIDWFEFKIDDGVDYFNVIFSQNEHNSNFVNDGWNISIYKDGIEEPLKVKTAEWGTVAYSFPNLPYNGIFYIKVEANNKAEKDAPIGCLYDIKVQTIGGDQWENEFNDTNEQATKISNNSSYSGVTTNRNDVDLYKFNIEDGVDYFNVIFAQNEHNSHFVNDGWNISIYKDGIEEPLKVITGEWGTVDYSFPNLPYKGTFYIKVEANNKTEDNAPIDCYYDVRVETHVGVVWENESNNSRDNATDIKTNSTYSGVTGNRNDIDWYKFEIDKTNCHFNVIFGQNEHNSHFVNDGWNISIYKEGIEKPLKVKTGEWGTVDYSFPSLPYKGTFLIKVEANNKTEDNAPIDCYYDIKVATHSGHAYKTTTTKATEKKDGKTVTACKICGAIKKTVMIPKASKITLSNTVYDYTGKAVSPAVTIKDRTGKALKNGKDYTVKYDSGRKTPGKYSVKVTFKGNYIGSKTLYFNILPTQTGKITATRTATSLKVNWKAVTGVDGYTVTLYSIRGYIIDRINTSKNTYTFKKLSSATTYKIKVQSYAEINGTKKYSNDLAPSFKTVTKPNKPTLQLAPDKGKAHIYCTEPYASGYEIYMKSGKSYKKVATVKTNYNEKGFHVSGVSSTYVNGVSISFSENTKEYVKTGLKRGTTYYFKARAYKTIKSEKIYGAFSAVKSVKVK